MQDLQLGIVLIYFDTECRGGQVRVCFDGVKHAFLTGEDKELLFGRGTGMMCTNKEIAFLMESLKLGKTFMITKSNHNPTTMTTKL